MCPVISDSSLADIIIAKKKKSILDVLIIIVNLRNIILAITARSSGWVGGGVKVGLVGLRCATDTGWYWVFIINTASPREVHLL